MWGRKAKILKFSLSQVSTMSTASEDSLAMEDAMEAVGSAVGLARVSSVRESRRNIRRGLSTQESTPPDDEDLPSPSMRRVLRTNSPEWLYIVVGLLSSVIMGGSMPIYAILFGEVMGILVRCSCSCSCCLCCSCCCCCCCYTIQ